jgi:hypothetical protein
VKSVAFPYQKITSLVPMPMLPVRLEQNVHGFDAVALLDSGASVSVLPHSMGLALSFLWNEARKGISLGGGYSNQNTRVVTLWVTVPECQRKAISFVWIPDDNARLILGQATFFHLFEVCFSGAKQEFYVREVGEA